MNYSVKDISLASEGFLKIEFAQKHMKALMKVKERFEKEKPLNGLRIGMALHVTKETAWLVKTLIAGGAQVAITSCNPLSTQDDVAASLAKDGIEVYGYKGESKEDYYMFLNKVLDFKPNILIDDGCDLITMVHKERTDLISEIIGGCEETTTGVIRLRAMEKDKAMKFPVIAVNDNKTKHLMDNYYGTGQSTLDGIIRATNILFAGKTVVVAGYGSCGKGVALRAKGMGANVIVTEVDNFCALQASMDGYRVMKMIDASKIGDIFITVTGDCDVITLDHVKNMKEGAILANSGHFNNEIDVEALDKKAESKKKVRDSLEEYNIFGKLIYLVGEGRLCNLAAAEGHPSEVMSMSFCGQALACEYLVKNRANLSSQVYTLPCEIDDEISLMQLESQGIQIDMLTDAQRKYLESWEEGT